MRSEVAIGTGMRRGDQLNLRWEKIDFQRNVIHVPNSKTGRDYTVPMNQDVRNELLALRKLAAKGDYVFTDPSTGKSFTEIKRAFHTACRLAGIVNLRWHDLPPCAMLAEGARNNEVSNRMDVFRNIADTRLEPGWATQAVLSRLLRS